MADATSKPKRDMPVKGPPVDPKYNEDTSVAIKGIYLAGYNILSAILWGMILARVISIAPFWGNHDLHRTTGNFIKWVQTMAVLEIFHSLFGIVRAPLFTTGIQVASRLILVWGIYTLFPSIPATHWQNSTMLLAWSATETIRYTYFFGLLGGLDELGGLPRWLKWARYNTFFVLYPMGIASECYLLYQSIPLARMEVDERAAWVLCGILAAYVPGAMVLYSHMMRQRRKVMRQEKGRQEDWKKTQ